MLIHHGDETPMPQPKPIRRRPEPDPDDLDKAPLKIACLILIVFAAIMSILTGGIVAIVWAIKHL